MSRVSKSVPVTAVGVFLLTACLVYAQDAAPNGSRRARNSFRAVVKKVLPAVVSIETMPSQHAALPKKGKRPRVQRFQAPDQMPVPEEFRKFFKDFGGFGQFPGGEDFEIPDVPQRGFGSGFLVDPKGVILTNYHVVKGADRVRVELHDGRKFISSDIKVDPMSDLAIVRIKADGSLPYLELDDSDQMEIGDFVLAVGAPFGLVGSVTHGIISAKGRDLRMNTYEDFLQTDAAINPGNSGGPLVDLDGRVVGVNTMIKTVTGTFSGVGLAISSNLAKEVVRQLEEKGVVTRGYLGVEVRSLDPEVAKRLGTKEGVLVATVVENSPAASAGLKEGDVITTLNSKAVHSAKDLMVRVARLAPKKTVTLDVVHDGKTEHLKATLAERPQQLPIAQQTPQRPPQQTNAITLDKVGATVADATPEAAGAFGFKEGVVKGALVTAVDPGSLAAEAGLRRGTLMLKVNNQTVSSAADVQRAVSSGSLQKGILFQVRLPDGGLGYVLVKEAS